VRRWRVRPRSVSGRIVICLSRSATPGPSRLDLDQETLAPWAAASAAKSFDVGPFVPGQLHGKSAPVTRIARAALPRERGGRLPVLNPFVPSTEGRGSPRFQTQRTHLPAGSYARSFEDNVCFVEDDDLSFGEEEGTLSTFIRRTPAVTARRFSSPGNGGRSLLLSATPRRRAASVTEEEEIVS
jgi:hypothetical protein